MHECGPIVAAELTQSQWADINEKNTLAALLSGKDTTLDGGTVGDGLIRVDSLGWFLAVEVFLEELLDLGDTGGSTDQDNLEGQLYSCAPGT